MRAHGRVWLLVALAACAGDPAGKDQDPEVTDPDPTGPTTDTPPTVTPPGECATTVSAATSPGLHPLEQQIEVTLDAPGNVWVVCTAASDTAAGDAGEQHLLESELAATSHTFTLRGILADTAYTCEARLPCGDPSAEASFTSGPLDPDLPVMTATQNPDYELDGAYTLFNTQDGCGSNGTPWVAMADPEGRIRWAYPVGTDLVTDIDAYLIDAETIHIGGGWGIFDFGQSNRGVFRTMDLSGRVLLERDEPEFGLGFNHHSEPLADGSYLTITGERDELDGDDWNGVGIELWHPDQGLLWTWDSQRLVDEGYIQQPGPFDPLPYHANAASMRTDALGEAAWVSIYGLAEIWRIDRASGDLSLVFGPGGDFSLFDVDGDPLPDAEFPWVQHGPDYSDDDRVLVYDNGNGRPGGDYSRIAEYQLDLAAREATLLWSWTEPQWHDPILGDADYLPNGHVLVTQGANQCLDPFGSTTSEILELAPDAPSAGAGATVVWRLAWPSRQYSTYRAERYGGCDVFANARYCPEIADRLATLRSR
jgi:hypothetical protein